jgi:hypothetical protein
MCEVEFPVQDVLNTVKDVLTHQIRTGCGATQVCTVLTNSILESLSASSYVVPKKDLAGAGFAPGYDGGFLVRPEVHWDVTSNCVITPHGSCDGTYLYDEQWHLGGATAADYGLPRIIPQQGLVVAGKDHEQNCMNAQGSKIDDGLGPKGTLEQTVQAIARARARQPITDSLGHPMACVAGGTPQASCLSAATTLLFAAQVGAAKLFNNNPPAGLFNELSLAVQDGVTQPDGSRNWECVQSFHQLPGDATNPDPTPDYVCNFIARAKRMIVNPDSLDLVLFDAIGDVTPGPTLPGDFPWPTNGAAFPGEVLFFAALGTGKPASAACQRPTLAGDTWARYYSTIHQKKYTCNDPGPRVFKDRVCNTSSDCPSTKSTFGSCDTVRNRCQSEPCKFDDECPAFERCVGKSCTPFGGSGCDTRDPYGFVSTKCPPNTLCQPIAPVRPWLPGIPGSECRQQ